DTDPKNCGMCGNFCTAPATCTGGMCQTPPLCNGQPACTGGEQCCATGCSNTVTDPKNCGMCANACAPGDTCVASACVTPTMCNGGPACPTGDTCCPSG